MHNLGQIDSLDIVHADGSSVMTEAADSVAQRVISVAEMFGAQSTPIEATPTNIVEQTLMGDTLFQLLTVMMMVAIIFFAARHKHQIVAMFGRMLKGRLPEDFSAGRRDELLTRSFLNTSSAIGTGLVILFAVKYAPIWLSERFTPAEGWLSTTAAVYASLGVITINIYEWVVLWIVGKVTRYPDITGALLYMKRAGFSLAAIAMSPILLLGILSSSRVTDMWNIILILECAILVLLFIKETLAFFIDKKIPIFHWILYLCAVEAFPLSLIWALTVRS